MTTNNLRQWAINPNSPYALQLAADSRICSTSYFDDQTWEVLMGTGDDPALALHTKYGMRVGLASIVPMWEHDGRVIYQAMTYHEAPTIMQFAPNFIALNGMLLPQVAIRLEHIAFDSQTMGAIYRITNNSERDVSLRLALFGHMGSRGKEEKLAIVSLPDEQYALSMSAMPTLAPVVMMDDGTPNHLTRTSASPKIGANVTVKAGESKQIHWVHVGLTELRESLAVAQRWLASDWQPFVASVHQAAQAIPDIYTGDADWDLVIASSYNAALQSILRPAGNFPRETIVTMRSPEVGYSRQDGRHHRRAWEGQDVQLTYLIAPAIAASHPSAAEGIIRNYLAVQQSTGFIDLKPGAASQKTGLLCKPILATIAWRIYEITQNEQFIKDVFGGLRKFFEYWLKQDADGDGYPEWQDDKQTGYAAFPTFSPWREWAQGANIATVESPDLLTYLIMEAKALSQMAERIGDKQATNDLQATYDDLTEKLQSLWDGHHYAYRDRDTDVTTSGNILLEEGNGDVEHILKRALVVPNRLIIKVEGGMRHTPKITLTVEGQNPDGDKLTETADHTQFQWQEGFGSYTTEQVFSQVERVFIKGLSRVYDVTIRTMDTTLLDINGVLPLWTGLSDTQKVADMVLDDTQFMRPNGITMTSAESDYFDPTNADGAGGVWMFWNSLLGEGLIKAGKGKKVTQMVRAQLDMLGTVLEIDHRFAQFYHSDMAKAVTEKGHISGIAPLALLNQLIGVQILSPSQVHLNESFAWGRAIEVRQFGVIVRRNTKGIDVEFPSGYTVELGADAEGGTRLTDPNPVAWQGYQRISVSDEVKDKIELPQPSSSQSTKRVIIEVETEE